MTSFMDPMVFLAVHPPFIGGPRWPDLPRSIMGGQRLVAMATYPLVNNNNVILNFDLSYCKRLDQR